MKLLIIGSDSFIAQNFIYRYSDDFKIKGISRVATGFSNEEIIPDLFDIPETSFKHFDVVMNFAAIVHRPDIKDEIIFDKINTKLAVLNAQKAKQAGIRLFIQLSTIAVYGNAIKISIDSVYNPKNQYAESKLKTDEALLKMQDDSFKVSIVRPPMVYGGGMAPGNMIRLIKLVNVIKLIPKGISNERDFINVNNLVQYLALIAQKKLTGICLVSDGERISTEYLLKIIGKCLGKKVFVIKVPQIVIKLFEKIKPIEYNKLLGSLIIKTNFPYKELIKKYTLEQGILEMVECYKNKQKYSYTENLKR